MKIRLWTILPFALSGILLFSGCNGWFSGGGDNSPTVASYKKRVLTQEKLNHYLPDNLNEEDSIRFANQYIDQWLREQAVADVALRTIGGLEDEIAYKVEDYRSKLILHEYTNYILDNNLDSTVSQKELEKRYNRESDKFLSKENLYSYFFVITTTSNSSFIYNRLKSDDPDQIRELKDWCDEDGASYKLDSSYALGESLTEINKGFFSDILNANEGKVMRSTGSKDGKTYRYFFKMINVLDEGSVLPLPLVEDRVRDIIINERKIKLIEAEEEKILKNAIMRNDIKN